MSEKPRVLVLTLSFGAGHLSAARNIIGEFQKQMPDADLRLIDALDESGFLFRVFYVWTYWAMIRYAPKLWKKFFESRVKRRDEQTAPVWIWKKGCRNVFEEIRRFSPHLIIAAEVGASEIAVIARRENLTNASIVNVITDFEAEPIWVKPEISAYFVTNEAVKNQLADWGADKAKIEVCGIPISKSFNRIYDSEETKARFGLDDRPIVLLMGGGMGPTRMAEVALHLLTSGENLQIVALPGKDEKAALELKKLSSTTTVSLRIHNWTSLIAPLMQAAQILATKPGGLTLTEAAACGLPLVLFDTIPGPEETNAQSFIAAGAAVLTEHPQKTADEILRILNDEETRRQMSVNCRKLARPDAACRIVESAKGKINRTQPDEKAAVALKNLSASRRVFAVWRKLKRTESFRALFTFEPKRRKSVRKIKKTLPEVKIG